jgi:hypothetical protein
MLPVCSWQWMMPDGRSACDILPCLYATRKVMADLWQRLVGTGTRIMQWESLLSKPIRLGWMNHKTRQSSFMWHRIHYGIPEMYTIILIFVLHTFIRSQPNTLIYVCTYWHTLTHMHLHARTLARTHTHTDRHMHTHMRTHTYTCRHVHTRTHAHTHTLDETN